MFARPAAEFRASEIDALLGETAEGGFQTRRNDFARLPSKRAPDLRILENL